jgi:hypothetical protein
MGELHWPINPESGQLESRESLGPGSRRWFGSAAGDLLRRQIPSQFPSMHSHVFPPPRTLIHFKFRISVNQVNCWPTEDLPPILSRTLLKHRQKAMTPVTGQWVDESLLDSKQPWHLTLSVCV